MTNTKQFKIRRAARVIAKGYIKTLEEGKEPLFLSAQVELAKYDILENVNDNRLNMADTLEAVRREAHWKIKDTLGQRPDLAAKLIQFRKEREEAAKAAEMEKERKNNQEISDQYDVRKSVSGITDEGAEALKRSIKGWADRIPFAVTYKVEWQGQNGPAAKVSITADVPRTSARKWDNAEKSLGRIIARVRRVYNLNLVTK